VFNLLLVLGLTAVVAPVLLPGGRQGWEDLVVMVGITCVLMMMAFSHRRIERWEGALLLAMYFAYMTWSVVREKPWA
jgi:cation:H+ antiporter